MPKYKTKIPPARIATRLPRKAAIHIVNIVVVVKPVNTRVGCHLRELLEKGMYISASARLAVTMSKMGSAITKDSQVSKVDAISIAIVKKINCSKKALETKLMGKRRRKIKAATSNIGTKDRVGGEKYAVVTKATMI